MTHSHAWPVAKPSIFSAFLSGAPWSSHRFYARLPNICRLDRGGDNDGRSVSPDAGRVLRPVGCGCVWLRAPEEAVMSWLYTLSGIVALVITIYLVIALLFPEKF
jgi:K+-transporting ATPase KdpF subunit